MLVTDETEGCLQRSSSQGVKKLSIPHTAAQIDFDGDCLSDLFITVQDTTSGKTYYEIYLRRELEQQPLNEDDLNLTDTQIDQSTYKGLNSFCLVTREEVPSQTNNLFSFADIDRDAMVDMLFVTKNDLSLHIYFNKLINQQQIMQQKGTTTSSQTTAFGLKKLCADTNRAVNRVKDIFSSFS